MKFNTIVNNILREIDEHMDIGPDEDPGAKGYTYILQLKNEIEELHDKLGYPTSNLSNKSVEELEKIVEIARKDVEIQRRYEDERPY